MSEEKKYPFRPQTEMERAQEILKFIEEVSKLPPTPKEERIIE